MGHKLHDSVVVDGSTMDLRMFSERWETGDDPRYLDEPNDRKCPPDYPDE